MRSWLAHTFLPHKRNKHRAWLLHPPGLATVATAIVGIHISLAVLLHFPILPGVLGENSTLTQSEVLSEINRQRTDDGLPELHNSPALAQAAQQKAEDMFSRSYWAHTSPDGIEPWDFIENSGYKYSIAGENLARNFHSTKMMVSAWMASPTHRQNILHTDYRDTGIAIVEGTINGKQTTVVVQLFGAPERQALADLPDQAYATTKIVVNTLGSADTNVLGAQLQMTPVHFYRAGIVTILAILLGVVGYDSLQLKNKRHRRQVGKNLAHIILLIAVITTVLLAESGTLL